MIVKKSSSLVKILFKKFPFGENPTKLDSKDLSKNCSYKPRTSWQLINRPYGLGTLPFFLTRDDKVGLSQNRYNAGLRTALEDLEGLDSKWNTLRKHAKTLAEQIGSIKTVGFQSRDMTRALVSILNSHHDGLHPEHLLAQLQVYEKAINGDKNFADLSLLRIKYKRSLNAKKRRELKTRPK